MQYDFFPFDFFSSVWDMEFIHVSVYSSGLFFFIAVWYFIL